MKAAVSLSELLNGNTRTRKTERNTNEGNEIEFNENESAESMDMSTELRSSSPLKTSQLGPKEKIGPSVQSFLMSSRQKKNDNPPPKNSLEEPEIIALDDDFDDETHLEGGHEKGGMLTTLSRVEPPQSSKTTTLKDLFDNFKPEPEPLRLKSSVVANVPIPNRKRKAKTHPIMVEAPFPSKQMVKPSENEYNLRKLDLPLTKKDTCIATTYSFDVSDYKSLNDSEGLKEKTGRVKIVSSTTKHNDLWTKLFQPKSLNDVILEPSLKNKVAQWIEVAFSKLKKPTTRTKMYKRQKLEYDPLDDFIVDESADSGNALEEFVPLMILHGEGIGKNTLLEVLMRQHNGQIYEVNTSSNRSKRDILDTLVDFSTTHYVKGPGSKGIILLDDVDVLFREHDKFFWQTVEKILLTSRRPIVLLCRDVKFIPANICQLAIEESSLFHCKKVSHQTVTAFLERYCRKINLKIDRAILNLLVSCSKRDIRKCLMDLQFCCTPPGNLKEPPIPPKGRLCDTNLEEVSHHLDLLSYGNILDNKAFWKSSISQDVDHTLMTPYAQTALNTMSEDQERLTHDYMIDYRVYLVDKLNHPQMPYELNVGLYLDQQLSKGKLTADFKLNSNQYAKMKNATIDYLRTRINKSYQGDGKARKTRNCRKMREILDRFEGGTSFDEIDESVAFDFEVNGSKNIKEQVNPYVLEIAKAELRTKEGNKEIFSEQCRGVDKDDYSEVAWQLTQQHLLKPIWFKSDPNIVIDAWKVKR